MCGSWGSDNCSPARWYDYMGDVTNGFAPFQVNYEYTMEETVGEYTVYDAETYNCNQAREGFVSGWIAN
jgi:hypothetical protein